jgi:diguanylate cyclase (GGDEF)-like protein
MYQAQRRGRQLAVAYLDLDGFKAINDTYGHEAGDRLLSALAGRMKRSLRQGDTIARLGGDEFVAVLIDLEDSQAGVRLLVRLLDAASEPVRVGELTLQTSASLGVAFYPNEGEELDPEQLLRHADQAMYQAKLAGKNRYHIFDADRDRDARGRHESEERVRLALERREFVLHYQPKVNMRTGDLVGAEALIRWQHPERGLLAPASFLVVIEEHPLSIALGEWVIEEALSQIEVWADEGLELPVSVNVGALQLQQLDFTERLGELLRAHPTVAPERLSLEVLETSALKDVARVSQVMHGCRDLGVEFALDDFGTGYSSLTYLKQLPATQLKIDRSFVSGMLDDAEDLAILEGVLGLVRAFRRDAIAEGVETVEHGEMLLRLGCIIAQGYYIARPMPAAELPAWAAGWRPPARWSEQEPMERQDLPLLFAAVEHRSWVRQLEHYLDDEPDARVPPDDRQCRFGRWLEGEAGSRLWAQPEFSALEALHPRLQALAAELLELHSAGRGDEARARLPELHALRDALLQALNELVGAITR